jgi:hypothetical protein
MRPLSAFRPRIALRVPGVPDPVIDMAVLDTCIDFCKRSLVVRRTLEPFKTKAGVREYEIDTANHQLLALITRIWRDSVPIDPLDEDGLTSPAAFTAVAGQQHAAPRVYTETEPGVLALYPVPDAVYTMTVRAASRPAQNATMVEDQLVNDWFEAITHGALARLFLMPNDAGEPRNPVAREVPRAELRSRTQSSHAASTQRLHPGARSGHSGANLMNTSDNQWHLDKKVPIALLLTMLLQFGGFMVMLGTIKAQGEDHERRISQLEAQKVSERLASLEAQVSDTKALLVRMEQKIDRIAERR